MAPTLVASRTALSPERALRLRPGDAGSEAPAAENGTPLAYRLAYCAVPGGALRLRLGRAGSAAAAGGAGTLTHFAELLT